jgi:hypothetical protein
MLSVAEASRMLPLIKIVKQKNNYPTRDASAALSMTFFQNSHTLFRFA